MMKKEHKIMARLLVVAATLSGAVLFYQQLDVIGTWRFYASLAAFLIFILFAVLVFRKTS